MPLRRIVAPLLAAALVVPAARAQSGSGGADDPFLWLEELHGERAMSWVRAENAKTTAVLERDPRFAGLYQQALAIAEARDRIPMPRLIGGQVYNFWQDAEHVRGIWRRTSVASYRSATPEWTTVLDLDQVAKDEKANWVWKGADCARPRERRCLVFLSDGGEDAVTVRELDLASRRFVDGGFLLPKGKQDVAWLSEDTLLVAREWTPGELTASGYPYVVKRLVRGQPLSAAVELFRGEKSDVAAGPTVAWDGSGNRLPMVTRSPSFFETETYLLTSAGTARLAIPRKANVNELVAGRLIVKLDTAWAVQGRSFPAGALVSLDLAAVRRDPATLRPTLVVAPGPRESVQNSWATRDRLIVTMYENVRGRAYVYRPDGRGGWTRARLPLPDNASIGVPSADAQGNLAFVSVTSFLTPTTLYQVDVRTLALAPVKRLPPKFDASRHVAEQYEAVSTDGTRIPYFVVHPRGMKRDGNNPTILYAYGGFQASMTPAYQATMGKLWLERGGVYVLANIRGGGEFGPTWHEAGLKTRRQIIYDDFAAVAKDLIARGITSPRRLGIQGGSNGGLLMGVQFNQHPELWNAVDIAVPLLDMLRYEQIAAGPSWVGEYGSVSNPKEREFLARISPYHNVKPGGKYPEPFIWTTTKDDRVGPQHARKFAARLASLGIPYLFFEVTEGGHGAGANLRQSARTTAMEMTYFIRKLMDEGA